MGVHYDISNADTLADCQRLCVLSYPDCAAVDYKEGKCSMIYTDDEYRTDELIDNVGNVHSVIKPCDTR